MDNYELQKDSIQFFSNSQAIYPLLLLVYHTGIDFINLSRTVKYRSGISTLIEMFIFTIRLLPPFSVPRHMGHEAHGFEATGPQSVM